VFVTHRSYHIAYTDLYRFILMVGFQLTHIHVHTHRQTPIEIINDTIQKNN